MHRYDEKQSIWKHESIAARVVPGDGDIPFALGILTHHIATDIPEYFAISEEEWSTFNSDKEALEKFIDEVYDSQHNDRLIPENTNVEKKGFFSKFLGQLTGR